MLRALASLADLDAAKATITPLAGKLIAARLAAERAAALTGGPPRTVTPYAATAPVWPWVLGGVAVAAAGVGVVWYVKRRKHARRR
jgi:lysozyme family protein